MKVIGILIALTAILSCDMTSNENNKITAEITQFGIFERTSELIRFKDPGSPSGYSVKSETSPKLAKQTDKIPLKHNIAFGYDFKITGFVTNGDVVLKEVITFPLMTLPNGEQITSKEADRTFYSTNGVVINGASYILNNDFEMIEGTWSRAYYFQGKRLLYKEFEVSTIF